MADRFPSLDEFDAGKTEAQGGSGTNALEEPSDFLARERAALGDDAEQFTTSADNTATVADIDGDDNDLLGGGYSTAAPTNSAAMMDGDMGDFESSFPAVDTANDGVAPGGTITGSTLPYHAPSANAYEDEAETEVVREWRERRDLQLQHRDEVSAGKKAETIKAAQEAIDEFYENYNNKKDKQIAQTKKEAEEFLKNREDTTSGGTSWERISKLVDLSGKGTGGGAPGTGKAKMRELLVALRKDENAPGATVA
ncbi:Clathrin light chain [Acrodontium crateriforme]|uniref:Clathrin light chain n=1 Tax=Acrodontium crateriforme TaxID=150365 RepID=A0AAQ3RDG3_9PEZI|nr:Clathrin light chain [Acrodontium crateriforme]